MHTYKLASLGVHAYAFLAFSTSIYLSPISIFNSNSSRPEEMMKNLLIDLPEDLFINNFLLSKVLLPIKALLSLRCVCKYLRNLITSTAFINMHLHHSTSTLNHQLNNQLVLIHSGTPYGVFYSLKFNDGDDPRRPEVIMLDYPIKSPKIWGSCNGLLCLRAKADDRVCLWNPSTKEYKDLPPPLPLTEMIPIRITMQERRLGSTTYGFGYDRFIDEYKIIRCENFVGHLDGDENNYGDHISITEFQVYTLGTNTWRKISPAGNNHLAQPFLNECVFFNGALHWVDMSRPIMTETKIASFDIEKEVFREIMQIPLIPAKDRSCITQIQVLRGCLCVLEFDGENFEESCHVWMMMDYGVKESWTKLFTIVLNEIESDEIDFNINELSMPEFRLLRFYENGEILIETGDILFIYDPTNNKARRVEFGEIDKYFFQSEVFIESLVSLNSGVYIESELIRAFGCIDLD